METLESFKKAVDKSFSQENPYVVVIYNDKFEVLTLKDVGSISADKLLDIRVFNEQKEIRMFREYAGCEFSKIFTISDDMFNKDDMYDDCQYLDVDLKRTKMNSGVLKATGGGEYKFPLKVNDKTQVRIRNYVAYDEDGQAYIQAWRLVDFIDTVGEVK